MSGVALLAGADLGLGAEPFAAHRARLGPMPEDTRHLVASLEHSGLRGRGGAAFPVASKWRSVAGRRAGRPVVMVNGAEGEPFSHKDRLLMAARPHLVLDGAALAARAVGAGEVVLYIGTAHTAALQAMQAALAERSDAERRSTRIVVAPARYVSGEESAAVHFVNDCVALPVTVPPRPFERGVGGRPTLVQNVETLAHVALIARLGDAWFRSLGAAGSAGTTLITVSGAVQRTAVVEVPGGASVTDAVNAAGGLTEETGAVLLGGYFGAWVAPVDAWGLRLDAGLLRAQGHSLGCGVIGLLPANQCGVSATSRVMSYLAHESARQCGPCTFGLRAIAAAAGRIASCTAEPDDLERVQRWSGLLRGRGACHHPDGAAGFLQSALRVFGAEFAAHHRSHRCTVRAPLAASA